MQKWIILHPGIADSGRDEVHQGTPGVFDSLDEAVEKYSKSEDCALKRSQMEIVPVETGTYEIRHNGHTYAYVVPIKI